MNEKQFIKSNLTKYIELIPKDKSVFIAYSEVSESVLRTIVCQVGKKFERKFSCNKNKKEQRFEVRRIF